MQSSNVQADTVPQLLQPECEDKDRPLYGELQLPFKHSYLHGHIYPPFVKVSPTAEALKITDDYDEEGIPKREYKDSVWISFGTIASSIRSQFRTILVF
jgi:hypothetical protein